jgi:hypothetical protein
MLNKSDLKPDQDGAIDRLYDHDETIIIAEMGGGKTIITLTAIAELLEDRVLKNVLIIAPLKVCQTVWRQEAQKWAHTENIHIAVACGSEKLRRLNVEARAEITVINFENVAWLMKNYGKLGYWDGLVVDELTKLKSSGGKTFKALRPRLKDFSWRVGLTGTPVSEDFEGLYAMAMVIDGGKALGTRVDVFKNTYFFPTDFQQYNWALHDGASDKILMRVENLIYDLESYTDELPPITYETVELTMPADLMARYDDFKNTSILAFDDDDVDDLAADSAAVLSGKLQQLASGFIYDEFGDSVLISDYRLRALDSLLCKRVKWPVVVCYWFKSDLIAMRERYPLCVVLGDDVEENSKRWNDGKIDMLLLHPRSAGHGLQLQFGGCNMIWYSPTWSRDLWLQTNARLWRRGQTKPVTITSIIALNTVDALVQARIEEKADYALMWDAYFSK